MTLTSRQTATVPLIRESDRGTGTFGPHLRQHSGQPPISINAHHSVHFDDNSLNPAKTFATPHISLNQPNDGGFNFSAPKRQNGANNATSDFDSVYTSKQHPAHSVTAPPFTRVNTHSCPPSPPSVYTSKHPPRLLNKPNTSASPHTNATHPQCSDGVYTREHPVAVTSPSNAFTHANTHPTKLNPRSVYTSKHATKPPTRTTAPSSTRANTIHSKLDDGVYTRKHPATDPETGTVFTRVNSTPHTPGITPVYTRKHTASGFIKAAVPCAHQSPDTDPSIADRTRNSEPNRSAKAVVFTRVNTTRKPSATQPRRTITRITDTPSSRCSEINMTDAVFARVSTGARRVPPQSVYASKQETCESEDLDLFTPDPSGVFTRVNTSTHTPVADRVYTRKQGWPARVNGAASNECMAFTAVILFLPAIPALQRFVPCAAGEMHFPHEGERTKISGRQNHIDQAAMLQERLAMS